jgi:hypothetical protein
MKRDIEAVMAVSVGNTVLWIVAPCSLVEIYRILEESSFSIFSLEESPNQKSFFFFLLASFLTEVDSIFLYYLMI